MKTEEKTKTEEQVMMANALARMAILGQRTKLRVPKLSGKYRNEADNKHPAKYIKDPHGQIWEIIPNKGDGEPTIAEEGHANFTLQLKSKRLITAQALTQNLDEEEQADIGNRENIPFKPELVEIPVQEGTGTLWSRDTGPVFNAFVLIDGKLYYLNIWMPKSGKTAIDEITMNSELEEKEREELIAKIFQEKPLTISGVPFDVKQRELENYVAENY